MKTLSVFRITSAVVVLLALAAGCRKPSEPVKPFEPCDHKEIVRALDPSWHPYAQFENPTVASPMGLYINAINWSDYASKVIPGRQYKIGYIELCCGDPIAMDAGFCNPPRKCIHITCMEEVKPRCPETPRNCLGTIINPEGFSEQFSHSLQGIGIENGSMKVRVGFSGCSKDEMKNLRLALQEMRFRCPEPKMDRVFFARVVTVNDFVCQAYFEEEACFDLSDLRSYLADNGHDMSQPVTIRLIGRDSSEQDFKYYP